MSLTSTAGATPAQRSFQSPTPAYTTAAAHLYEQRTRAALAAIGAVLADPAPCLALAERCGLKLEHVGDDEDLRILLAAPMAIRDARWFVDRDTDRANCLKLARAGLSAAGLFDGTDNRPFVTGCLWSDRSLTAVAHQFPRGTSAVPMTTHRLIDLSVRIDIAREAMDTLDGILSGRRVA